jgi:hypothetical protein
MMQTPDGNGRLELTKFHSPPNRGDNRHAPANTPGIRHVAFAVEDIDATRTRRPRHARRRDRPAGRPSPADAERGRPDRAQHNPSNIAARARNAHKSWNSPCTSPCHQCRWLDSWVLRAGSSGENLLFSRVRQRIVQRLFSVVKWRPARGGAACLQDSSDVRRSGKTLVPEKRRRSCFGEVQPRPSRARITSISLKYGRSEARRRDVQPRARRESRSP